MRSGSRVIQPLLFVLSIIAGCTDVITFLGLNGLFTSHITGNLVVLAAHIVLARHLITGNQGEIGRLLAFPVFVVVVSIVTIFADKMKLRGISSLRPLMLLQLVLLAAFVAIVVSAGPKVAPDATIGILAGVVAVSAMAVQNAAVQFSLGGAPATSVMTVNTARFGVDIGKYLASADPAARAEARSQVMRASEPIVGFLIGCALGAECEFRFGLYAAVLPAGLAVVSLSLGFLAE